MFFGFCASVLITLYHTLNWILCSEFLTKLKQLKIELFQLKLNSYLIHTFLKVVVVNLGRIYYEKYRKYVIKKNPNRRFRSKYVVLLSLMGVYYKMDMWQTSMVPNLGSRFLLIAQIRSASVFGLDVSRSSMFNADVLQSSIVSGPLRRAWISQEPNVLTKDAIVFFILCVM